MPQANRSKKFIIRSSGSSYPFEKIHHPFERFELSVRKNSSAVRTVRAIRSKKLIIRSRKFISRLNGSSYPLEKFINRLNDLSYPFKKETVSYFGSHSNNTSQDKTFAIRQALLNNACRHVHITQKVVTLLFFVYLRLMTLSSFFFTGKRLIHKLLSNRKPYGPYVFVHGGFRIHALLPCDKTHP